jgi:hypothetical protein
MMFRIRYRMDDNNDKLFSLNENNYVVIVRTYSIVIPWEILKQGLYFIKDFKKLANMS